MKSFITLGLLSFFFLLGCDQELDLTSQTTLPISSDKHWITLSDNGVLSIEETFTKTKKNADGSKGWNITYDHTFSNGVRVYGDLDCPDNAYSGKLTFSFTLSNELTITDFYPTPFEFNIPVEYTIIYEGLDLTGVDPEDVDFYYIAPDGSMVKAVYDNLQVDIPNGRLFVLNARLPHFSRYGFVN